MRDQQRKALADEILDLVTTGAAADGRQSSQGGRIDREERSRASELLYGICEYYYILAIHRRLLKVRTRFHKENFQLEGKAQG